MSATERYTATRTSIRTASIMVLFTVVFTTLMSGTYWLTRPAIEASQLQERMRLINELLPASAYNNALLEDFVELGPTPELGLDRGGRVYRARFDGQPAALILESVAPDGYAGRISLAVAVNIAGQITGVRVTEHKETPGLGDYIDPRKDRNKQRPWVTQFDGLSFAQVSEARWKVSRDGGHFDYMIGATISARAVTHASARALAYASTHRNALFAAETGSRL
ncbi:MAG: electron transport complex subunit RsxG [Rhodocyclaceae bacterium]|jgi:electron transport complex protein RnfG|nr:electron transport complex subunit RsxG [Rhodocyclaceae bacterium]